MNNHGRSIKPNSGNPHLEVVPKLTVVRLSETILYTPLTSFSASFSDLLSLLFSFCSARTIGCCRSGARLVKADLRFVLTGFRRKLG